MTRVTSRDLCRAHKYYLIVFSPCSGAVVEALLASACQSVQSSVDLHTNRTFGHTHARTHAAHMQHTTVFVCSRRINYSSVYLLRAIRALRQCQDANNQSSVSNRLVAVVMLFYYPISLLKDKYMHGLQCMQESTQHSKIYIHGLTCLPWHNTQIFSSLHVSEACLCMVADNEKSPKGSLL